MLGQSRLVRCRRMLSGQSCSDTLVPVLGSSSGLEPDGRQQGQELGELEQELAGNIADEQGQLGQWAWLGSWQKLVVEEQGAAS